MLKTTPTHDHAIIYHWWQDHQNFPAYANLTYPIVASIASTRAHTNVPIYVLDVSDEPHDWGGFPIQLNFKVIQYQSTHKFPWETSKLCSRIWDVPIFANTIKENKILFTDSDIFWLQNPFPLQFEVGGLIDSFYCREDTGVWYFDRRSESAKKTIKLWRSILAHAEKDESFHDEIYGIKWSKQWSVQDEVAFNYLIDNYSNHYHPIRYDENCPVDHLRNTKCDMNAIKCLHAVLGTLGPNRGLAAILVQEFAELMKKVLTADHIKMLFGDRSPVFTFKELRTMSSQELKYQLIEHLDFCPPFSD